MFNLFGKKKAQTAPPPPQPSVHADLRKTLLGDVPPNEWPSGNGTGHPWSMFVEARDLVLVKNNVPQAINIYRKILEEPGLESRHYLQAWFYLRKLGVNPPPEVAKKVYGVVVDVHLQNGLELIAAYADHTARYINYTGSVLVWEASDPAVDAQIDELLKYCAMAAAQIKPLGFVRPNPPKDVDGVQICILTPSGLHHGIGTFDGWAKNEFGGPIVYYASQLMNSLVNKAVAKK